MEDGHLKHQTIVSLILAFDNIHGGPICCEQAGTVSNCFSTSCTTTTQSCKGGVEWVGWVWDCGGPGHYVVTPTIVEVELDCDNWYII